MKGRYIHFFIIFPQSFIIISWKNQSETSVLKGIVCPLMHLYCYVQLLMWAQMVPHGVYTWPLKSQSLFGVTVCKELKRVHKADPKPR